MQLEIELLINEIYRESGERNGDCESCSCRLSADIDLYNVTLDTRVEVLYMQTYIEQELFMDDEEIKMILNSLILQTLCSTQVESRVTINNNWWQEREATLPNYGRILVI